eukprot:PhF_6_TR803/c0_g1_i3/m.1226/K02874/RP-L14, MRPL14, rplN; large subunit ribosomal protein L14
MFRRCTAAFQAVIDTPTKYPYLPDNPWKKNNRFVKRRWAWPRAGTNPNQITPLTLASKVHCVDNSNCRQFYLLRQVSENTHSTIFLPCIVRRVAILRFKSGHEVQPRQKLVPGTVMYACVMTRRQVHARRSGISVQFDKNTGVLLNETMQPVGTRVMYAAGRHINHKAFLKVAVMANFIV